MEISKRYALYKKEHPKSAEKSAKIRILSKKFQSVSLYDSASGSSLGQQCPEKRDNKS